jgi:hypothetical protein
MSNQNVSGWLPNLLGITKVQSDGTDVTARQKLNFVGASVTSNADTDSIDVELTGTVPTGTGLRKVASGTENAAASLLVNADVDAAAAIAVTKLAAGTANYVVKVNSGGTANEHGLITNANVDAAAAIAGTKVSPDFGSQNITTTGALTSAGATMHGTVTSPDATGGAKATCTSKKPVTTTTEDDMITTLDSFTLATDTTVVVTYVVTAIKDDETQAATYIRTACFRNDSGTVTQVGTTQDGGTFEDDAAWDCNIDVGMTLVQCNVTGKAATNIRWACVSERLELVY